MKDIVATARKYASLAPINYWTWTSLLLGGGEHSFRKLLLSCGKINTVIEIGTFLGLSTAVLADYADKVYTFDIIDYSEGRGFNETLWKELNVTDKIERCVAKSNKEKSDFVTSVNADLAFVDGCHADSCVRFDFSLVSNVPRIIMHDYGMEWPDVTAFVDSIEGYDKEILVPFVLLRKR